MVNIPTWWPPLSFPRNSDSTAFRGIFVTELLSHSSDRTVKTFSTQTPPQTLPSNRHKTCQMIGLNKGHVNITLIFLFGGSFGL